MKLVSWNVSGLRAVLKKGFLEFVKKEQPDVICLQETKLDKKFQMNITGYENVYWNNGTKDGYAGTAVFSKIKPLKFHFGIGKEEHDKEGRVITLEFEKYFLINVYTPNSQRGLTRLDYRIKWDKDFLDYAKKLNKPVIICGDMNVSHKDIDLANPKTNRMNAGFTEQERGNFDKILEAGFVDSLRVFNDKLGQYTFWIYFNNARERNIGWRLDYFLVSDKFRNSLKIRH